MGKLRPRSQRSPERRAALGLVATHHFVSPTPGNRWRAPARRDGTAGYSPVRIANPVALISPWVLFPGFISPGPAASLVASVSCFWRLAFPVRWFLSSVS